jgi:hypothetical protein
MSANIIFAPPHLGSGFATELLFESYSEKIPRHTQRYNTPSHCS